MSKLHSALARRTPHLLCAAALAALGQAANAALSVGTGGRGVAVGQSSLIDQYDYADTWTSAADGGNSARTFGIRLPDAGYVINQRFSNPSTSFLQDLGTSDRRPNMSIAVDRGNGLASSARSPYPGAGTAANSGSGAGSASGFTQQGLGAGQFFDYGIYYLNAAPENGGTPIRNEFIAQFDAVQTPGQVRITVSSDPGPSSSSVSGNGALIGSLTVAFNGDNVGDAARANRVALLTYVPDPSFPGEVMQVETLLPNIVTGLAGNRQWHNYAVRFDRADNEIQIYLDEVSLGIVRLADIANGLYSNFDYNAISVGASAGNGTTATPFGDRIWTDNVQIGSVAVPEPMSAAFVGLGLVGLGLIRRGRRTPQ